jgi:hypothetical protein
MILVYNRSLSPDEVSKLYQWAPGPVAYYKLDEKNGNTAYDSAASTTNSGGNHGTLGALTTVSSSSPAWTRGKYGSALSFDGENDQVSLSGSGLVLSNNHTISMWVNVYDQKSHGASYAGLLTDPNGGMGLYFRENSSDKLSFYYSGADHLSNDGITKYQWHHIAYTNNNGNVTLYIDGVENSTATGGVGYDDGANRLGGHGEKENFYGLIDDVRIYNYARTPKQILEDMSGSVPGHSTGLNGATLHLKFDEGKGATAYNSGLATTSGVLYPGTGGTNTASSAMWTMDGKFGKAIEFDGTDDYVKINNGYWLRTPEFSVSYWVKVKTQDTNYQINVQKIKGDDSNGYVFDLRPTNDATYPSRIKFNLAKSATDYPLYSTTIIQNGQWYHIVGTYSNSVSKLYINGILENSTSTADYDITNDPMYVGIEDGNPAWGPFDGLIDELKVYSYELSLDNVKTDYNQGVSAVMGSIGKATSTAGSSNASSLEYCVPGDTATCTPPVGEWKLDEKTGATAYDTSGNGNDGQLGYSVTVSSSSPDWTRGKIGSALDFDGSNDYVNIPRNSAFEPATAVTVSTWFYWDDNTSSVYGKIITKGRDVNVDPYMSYEIVQFSGQNIMFGVNIGGVWRPTGNVSITEKSWHYLTGTWSSGQMPRLYVDGVQTATGTAGTGSITYWATPLRFGWTAHEQDNSQIDGKIDQVRIYNYARTPAQIAWEFNRGKPIAQWSFDECKGETIYDSAKSWNGGTANNGTLNLGTSGVTATGTCASSSNSFWYNGRTGKYNSAGSFDGANDYVDIPDNVSIQPAYYTIAGWFYKAVGSSGRDVMVARQYRSSSANTSAIYVESATEDIRFYGSFGGSSVTVIPNVIMTEERWYYIATSYDGTNIKMYIDGELVNTKSETRAVDYSANNWFIGADQDNTTNCTSFWQGLIDEVKIYNYALTADQVKSDYAGAAVRFGQ